MDSVLFLYMDGSIKANEFGTDLVRPRERSVGNQGIGETWNAEVA